MTEKWKHNAARALERLAYGVEKLADEFQRYNDRKYQERVDKEGLTREGISESERKPKRQFSCPACDSRATVRATTDIRVTLDCNDGHPIQAMEEKDEVQ